jgi:uncharacterized cupredoxin-like copper-binding protein
MKRLAATLAMLALTMLVVAAPASTGTAAPTATTTIRVAASEMKFVLSAKSAKRGTVVFVVRNRGNLVHDLKIKGKKTPLLQPGKTARLNVTFTKAGKYQYLCTVFGHAAAGMKGVFTVR